MDFRNTKTIAEAALLRLPASVDAVES